VQSAKKPVNLDQIVAAVSGGLSSSRICVLFGLSETRYYQMVRNHPKQFEAAKKKQLMAQKKKQKEVKELHQGPKVRPSTPQKRITPEEKVQSLEKQLERQQKENDELRRLLEVAQEHLGKL
jgi:hypothetical protein